MRPEADNDLPRRLSLRESDADSVIEKNEIDFLGYSKNYFVCFIDIVDSTKMISSIDDSLGIRKYYGIFLNTVARIAREHEGRIVKSAGDSLFLYFPNTADPAYPNAFDTSMKCCLEILDAHESMNLIANLEHLPRIDFRISADYGKVEVARTRSSTEYDLLGHTMNICAKMNSKAKPQEFVIGSDLYQILRSSEFPFDRLFDFQIVGEYSTRLRYNYPIFAVRPRNIVQSWSSIPPRYHPSRSPPRGDDNDGPKNLSKRHRIMIIDDEPDTLLTYKSMLEGEAAFEVETYASSQDALQNLFTKGTSFYDLIITDIRMPQPNGLQLYNIIKSLNKQTRVLLITAYDVIEEIVSTLPGIKHEHILKKPLTKPDLLREVKLCTA
jgi:class 3 adenylate cyclase